LFYIIKHLEETLSVTEGREVTRGGLFSEVLSSNNFVGEGSKDTHHSSTSVVKFSILLASFFSGFFIPVVDVSKPDAVVSVKLGGWPPGKLNKSANNKDLGKSSSWELEKSSDTGVDVREFKSIRWGKVSIEGPVVVVDESSGHSHHSNTSVFTLNSTVTSEGIVISDVSKRIEVSKRGNGSDLFLRKLQLGGGLFITKVLFASE